MVHPDIVSQIINNRMYTMLSLMHQKLRDNGVKTIRFSAYPLDEFDVPVDNLDEVVYKGEVTYTRQVDPDYRYWSSENATDFTVDLVDPTWMDLCIATENSLDSIDNYHHIFLEGYWIHKDENGKVYLFPSLGS